MVLFVQEVQDELRTTVEREKTKNKEVRAAQEKTLKIFSAYEYVVRKSLESTVSELASGKYALSREVKELREKNSVWADRFLEETMAKNKVLEEKRIAIIDKHASANDIEETLATAAITNDAQGQELQLLRDAMKRLREEAETQTEDMMVAYGNTESDARYIEKLSAERREAVKSLDQMKRVVAARNAEVATLEKEVRRQGATQGRMTSKRGRENDEIAERAPSNTKR
ncbi:hypothetical protein QFC21_005298 [Naganishia friedmannii]|uniref:Uncharacterized protein n=1 Tax=Naganishia friedmannii TaxID=89922 RepID=A0ACC2VCZ0_9TREE|nr:hypothetical protein QFC21_005298 [Naganishia friedmannii]